jgi:hypothetical protein
MTPSHCLVVDYQDRQPDYPPLFQSNIHAIDAAIDFAEKDGKVGRPRKYWCKSIGARGRKDIVNHLDLWTRPGP